MESPPKLIAADAAFAIAGPTEPRQTSWQWDVTAKTIGTRRYLTLQFPTSSKSDFKFENPLLGGDKLVVNGTTVTATVDVRDELGLTQAERTILSRISAVAALFGTVFA